MNNVNILAKRDKNKSILDSILDSRGIIDKEKFLSPLKQELISPFVFSDMEKAVNIISDAISNNDKILIWGDFDADGVTSTSILYKALSALGANFDYFMPDRLTLGHGIHLKELLKRKSKNNIKVLITVDCGISNIKEVSLIKSMGVKTIITDHHEPLEVLPDADCILNPLANNSLKNDLSVNTINDISYLSGAGVAMKLAFALLGDKFPCIKDEILVLSAIGTISDVVPLLGENRVIAAIGLSKINQKKHLGVARLFEKENIKYPVKSDDIAFILAPRINSAGRLDTPFESIKLLIEDNTCVLDMVIEKLNALNKIRQNLCEKTFNEALPLAVKYQSSIVLYNSEWHIGIIGIVASRLVEKFNVPVFLVTKDEKEMFRCSIRAPKGYNVYNILNSVKDCFTGFGGHSGAGGFSADSKEISFEELTKRISNSVAELSDNAKLSNKIDVDIEISGNELTYELLEEIEKLEPCGAENKKPLFLFKDAKVVLQKTIGKEANHLAYSVLKDDKLFNCLYWNRKILGFNNGEMLDIIFKPEISEFNGEKEIKLMTSSIVNDKLDEKYSKTLKIFDHRQKTGILNKVDEYTKSKNGEVKIYAQTIFTKKLLKNYLNLLNHIITEKRHYKSVMMFDYPSCTEDFREFFKNTLPDNLHLMNCDFSKNPDDYITTMCGMLKYATHNKGGEINIKLISELIGLDEVCVNLILELLEKTESIRIYDIDRIEFLKAPNQSVIQNDSVYELYCNEFNRVIDFKTYLKTAPVEEIEKLCKF